DAGCAAAGGLKLCAVLPGEGAGDRARRVVARGRRGRRLCTAVEVYRDVLWPGDCDLADRGAEAEALAAVALALSRRPRGALAVCTGHPVECRSPMGILHQAVRP